MSGTLTKVLDCETWSVLYDTDDKPVPSDITHRVPASKPDTDTRSNIVEIYRLNAESHQAVMQMVERIAALTGV